MKVSELMKVLEELDPETEVVLQGDAEGNTFMSLYSYWQGGFNEEDGEAGYLELTGQLKKQGYTEEDIIKGKPAIMLWG
jgi:hypothetical protein